MTDTKEWIKIDEIELEDAKEWVKIQMQVLKINPDSKGIIVFTYGTEDYMVSGAVGKRLSDNILPELKEKFPNHSFIFVPFYISVSDVLKDLEELE